MKKQKSTKIYEDAHKLACRLAIKFQLPLHRVIHLGLVELAKKDIIEIRGAK